jgi:hypothetical protein
MDARCSVEQPDYIPAAAFAATFKVPGGGAIRERETCWLLAAELNAVYGNFLPE